jgi:hypothetical protein
MAAPSGQRRPRDTRSAALAEARAGATVGGRALAEGHIRERLRGQAVVRPLQQREQELRHHAAAAIPPPAPAADDERVDVNLLRAALPQCDAETHCSAAELGAPLQPG